jgi:hypothetical protein
MDQISLVEELREGEELLEWLDEHHFQVQNAFWAKPTESDQSFYYLSTPYVETHGPLQAYRLIGQVLREKGAVWLSTRVIRVVRTDDPIAIDVREKLTPRLPVGAFGVTPPRPFAGVTRYGSIVLGDVEMDWAILYPTRECVAGSPSAP